jgi:hypothetical protein
MPFGMRLLLGKPVLLAIRNVLEIDTSHFSSGAKFRRFQESSFRGYKQPPTRFCAMVIRYILWRKHGKGYLLGGFKPKVTKVQQSLFKELYELVLAGEDVELERLAAVTHRILLSSFTLSLDVRNQVDSAVEQFMIFAIMTPTIRVYLSALSHTQLFARMQRTVFSTLLHTAWHGGADADFELEGQKDGAENDVGELDDIGSDFDREAEEVEDSVEFYRFDETQAAGVLAWDGDMFDNAGVDDRIPATTNDEDEDDMGMEILTGRDGDDELLR